MSKEKVIELLLRGALQATAATIASQYVRKMLIRMDSVMVNKGKESKPALNNIKAAIEELND